MIEIDETALTEFFSVEPERQSEEETEFFAAPCHVIVVDGVRLEFSASANFEDVRFHLQREGSDDHLLDFVMTDVESIAIEANSDDGREWLHARSRVGQVLRLAVAPTITVDLAGNH